MKFSDKLRKYRTEKHLTQSEVANAVGISRRTYLYYESGSKYPRKKETIEKLADFFKIDKNMLIIEDDEYLIERRKHLPEKERCSDLLKNAEEFFSDKDISKAIKRDAYALITELFQKHNISDSEETADN